LVDNSRGNYNNSNNRNYSDRGGGGGGGSSSGGGGYNNDYKNNNSYQNEPQFNSSGNTSDVQVQKETIFIQNLPKSVVSEDLEKHFGSIGLIKIDKKTSLPKIWIYKDKQTGEGKGEATVTYDDEAAASAAIEWFNGKMNFKIKNKNVFLRFPYIF